MKLISFVVPCYNSQEYMRHCIDTLLPGGDQVEILIVNDGSSDNTAAIADEYEKKYPDICRAIHQENKGHGGAVNTGIKNATGIYLKVVDSDDWVNEYAYGEILDTLANFYKQGTVLDMLLSNYVYEKQGAKKKTVIHYRHAIPKDQIFCWDDVGRFPVSQYILMHSVIYRTALLRECDLELPEHTFYVDNLFAFEPLPFVKNMYYLDVNFYRYFIGREDQSVNEKVMIGRIDQQIKVNKLMIEEVNLWKIANPKLRKYMFNYLEIITVVSTVLCLRSETEENLMKKRELWSYIKGYDLRLFHHLRRGILGQSMNLPGKGGRKISVAAYKLTQKIVGFN